VNLRRRRGSAPCRLPGVVGLGAEAPDYLLAVTGSSEELVLPAGAPSRASPVLLEAADAIAGDVQVAHDLRDRLGIRTDERQFWRSSGASLRTRYGPKAAHEPEWTTRTTRFALRREARSRTRTDDPFLTMEVLYRLSYPGTMRCLRT